MFYCPCFYKGCQKFWIYYIFIYRRIHLWSHVCFLVRDQFVQTVIPHHHTNGPGWGGGGQGRDLDKIDTQIHARTVLLTSISMCQSAADHNSPGKRGTIFQCNPSTLHNEMDLLGSLERKILRDAVGTIPFFSFILYGK